MLAFFIVLQFILLAFMLFHDWVSVPPFNNVPALKAVDSNAFRLFGSVINGLWVAIPLALTLNYAKVGMPMWAKVTILLFYAGLSLGTILSWWTPYFFGSSLKHRERFKKFKETHHFLPRRGENVVPNTLHVILHLQVWTCCLIALYFLIAG